MDELRESLSGQAGLLCELLTAAMEPKLADTGVSLGTFELLSAVHASGGKATQIEVARRLGITPPSLSESVKGATSRNLLEQHIDSDDGRRKILKLTITGRKAMQSIVKGVNNAESRMVDGIDAAQVAVVIDVLKKVNRNLARIVQEESEPKRNSKSSSRATKRAYETD
jgi:MarR family transcriptional regulator for hemolysin